MKQPDNFKKAHYRAIPVYYNPMTEEIEGRNWFYRVCLAIAMWFDTEILCLDSFPLWVEVTEDEIKHLEELRKGFK